MPEIAPLEAWEPRRLGRFRVVGRVGEGGQGIVYLGESESGERAAIKLLHVKFSGDAIARSRFAREARAARRVSSFCTAAVIEVDVEGDTPYIASEYIEGRSLRETVESDGPLRGTALQRLAVGTATALTAIHHASIVHRDFKPDNVLLAADGPRVVDFGIARILDSTGTITSRAIGTPAYMAPEQISGDDVGPHSDVFSWGATIAFAATGETAFAGKSLAMVLNRILNHEVDVTAMPEPLRGVVRSALAKAPSARPSADQILLRLLGRPESGNVSPALLSSGVRAADPVSGPLPATGAGPSPATGTDSGPGAAPGADAGSGVDESTRPMRLPTPGVTPVPPAAPRGATPVPPAAPPGRRATVPSDSATGPPPIPGPGPGLGPGPAVVPAPGSDSGAGAGIGTGAGVPVPGSGGSGRPSGRRRVVIAVLALVVLLGGGALAATAAGWRPWAAFRTGPVPSSSPSPTKFASVADKAARTRRLSVGLRDYLPGIALNSGGGWSGFEVDLAVEIARALGVPRGNIEFRATSRQERPALLASGALDLVISTYPITPGDDVTFAGPYYVAHTDVLVKDSSPITSAAGLEGGRLCGPDGAAAERVRKEAGRLTVVPAQNYTECVNMLATGKVDGIAGDDLVLAGFAAREGVRYRVLGLRLTDERYAVAMRRGDVRTCEAVRGVVADLYGNGTIGKLLDRHLSRVRFPTRERSIPAMAACR
ncbi:serine/threonine-protein kinase [Streptosporangium sandarakinum]|uniref:serine/threonine-protein kinase n=1 Tax=Streptosporangium sandarakinum TaxID=1260955 RepID=UPI003D9294B9